jgi:small GTP-binding protein
MIRKKICMLGAFAAGKTSLVQRFVAGLFSEKYHTTIGVKIDRREVAVDGGTVTLLLWDLAGEDEFQRVRMSYLRGSAGLLFVVDGTRRGTLDQAKLLRREAHDIVGDVPVVVALNKSDLATEWELDAGVGDHLRAEGWTVFVTSAKSGVGVEEAFRWLAHAVNGGT